LGDAVARHRDDRQKDLLPPALEEIIASIHPLVQLAHKIDWPMVLCCLLLSAAHAEGSLVPSIKYVPVPNQRPLSKEGRVFADNRAALPDEVSARGTASVT
jgi:hypothetical protein